jgi:hypothetical protein
MFYSIKVINFIKFAYYFKIILNSNDKYFFNRTCYQIMFNIKRFLYLQIFYIVEFTNQKIIIC